MAQHDGVIDNGPGLAVRTDINAVLQALLSQNSGPVEPTTKYPGMIWLDTTVSPDGIMRQRNQANTAWITVAGTVPEAPSDNNEYVRVNGTWRLSRQSYAPTGAGAQVITVPAAAKLARVAGKIYLATQPSAPLLRASADGSTFLSGASDYSVASTTLPTGTGTSPAKAVAAAASGMALAVTSDTTNIPATFDCDLMVSKPASPALFGVRWHGSSYNTNAITGYVDILGNGYLAAAAFTALTQLPAFQIAPSGGTWAAGTLINVQWIY